VERFVARQEKEWPKFNYTPEYYVRILTYSGERWMTCLFTVLNCIHCLDITMPSNVLGG
jgi:hypothetical protein